MRTRAWIHVSLLALLSVSTLAVFAVIPSCEEEIAQAYPPAAMADLGVCENPAADVVADSKTNLAKFTARLNGTWKLRSRTLQGLPVGSASHYARLYFDIDHIDDQRIAGKAVLIDHAVLGEIAPASDPVAAAWSLRAELREDGYLSLKMSAEPVGPYAVAYGLGDEEHSFFEDEEVFVSVIGESLPSNSWDRMVLMEESLTYVSCERGTVERFTKLSSDEPMINGVALEDYLQKVKDQEKPKQQDTVASLGTIVASGFEGPSTAETRSER